MITWRAEETAWDTGKSIAKPGHNMVTVDTNDFTSLASVVDLGSDDNIYLLGMQSGKVHLINYINKEINHNNL